MSTLTQSASRVSLWFWRGAFAAVLTAALLAAPAAQAGEDDPATITVYAPGAPVGASVSVQRQVGSGWVTVNNWQGTLFSVTYLGVPFETLAVDPSEYDQGPFRWVIDNLDGRSIWAVSEPFFLPARGGLDLAMTVGPATVVGLPTTPHAPTVTIPAPAVHAPVLNATNSVWDTFCHAGNCNFAQISTYVTGLPVSSWIAVEWQDAQGYWHPVANWEGPPSLADPPALVMYQQWTVMPELYGRGPFRWAIYTGANGGVLGVSPSFNLPSGDHQNSILYLSP